ncbi:MAG: hypothetical protein CMF45_08370 [Legionellales bacterium]|nr:hypothetical protein [Legionellales bacterium]
MNKQIFIDKGRLVTKKIPEFNCRPGELIVDVLFSAFSSGTEFGELAKSSESLLSRARKSPEKIGKAINMIKATGLKNTINFVEDSQLALQATGYSLAGIVKSVGEGINDFVIGDLVACSGAQYAHHATQVKVSKQLCVKIPDGLSASVASTVTLGSIAMQGVRQANVVLGERVAVIGLGVIGQITSQILLAAGAKVTGFDLDTRKIQLATDNGLHQGLDAKNSDVLHRAQELTDGYGFDKVLICSSDPSPASAEMAFEISRHRATVVMIGGIGLDLNRSLMYYKELNFVASMSYGPGRYERDYEERGLDLPISYVRWTENRNMLSYLEVAKDRENNLKNLIGRIVDFDDAEKYLNSEEPKTLNKPLIIIKYLEFDRDENIESIKSNKNTGKIQPKNKKIQLGLIGAGGFVKNFILPNLSNIDGCNVAALVSSDSAAIVNMRKKYDIDLGFSSVDDVLDCDIDAVIVANRHSEHFDLIKRSLNKGKHVFIEKPTVNKAEQLEGLLGVFSENEHQNQLVYTGYNRAFSPHIKFVQEQLENIKSPIMLSYQMNAGALKKDNWQYDLEEGGRNIGEAVHIYHLFGALFKSKPESISVTCVKGSKSYMAYDNFSANIRYENGCVGILTYTSIGSDAFPKESFIMHSGGTTIVSNNYTETKIVGGKTFKTSLSEKGHREVLQSFIRSLIHGTSEMTREEQIDTMHIAFCVESELRDGLRV